MRFIRYSVFAVGCLAPLSLAFGQSPGLEQRVDSLEHKLDAIMELLQQQKGVPSTQATETRQPGRTSTPDGFVPGLYMDVYAPAEKSVYDADGKRSLPEGFASASVAIRPKSTFSYGEIQKHNETSSFAVENRVLPSVIYNGYLLIKDSGRQAIGINVNTSVKRCVEKLILNGNAVIDRYTQDTKFDSVKADLNLQAGLYKFQLYFECQGGYSPYPYDQQTVEVTLASPGERAPKPISPDLFYIKQ